MVPQSASARSNGFAHRRSIVAVIEDAIRAAGPDGMTDDELAVALRVSTSSINPRRRTLVLANKVADSGQRRPTRTGRMATVWIARGYPARR